MSDDQESDRVIRAMSTQIYIHSPSSGGRAFQLPCRTTGCYSMGKVLVKKHQVLTDATTLKTAEHFYSLGWRYDDGPLCPECARVNNS